MTLNCIQRGKKQRAKRFENYQREEIRCKRYVKLRRVLNSALIFRYQVKPNRKQRSTRTYVAHFLSVVTQYMNEIALKIAPIEFIWEMLWASFSPVFFFSF